MKNILFISSSYSINSEFKTDPFLYEFCESLASKVNIFVLTPHCYGSKFKEIIDGVNIVRFPYFFPLKSQTLAYGHGGIPYNIKKCFLAKIQVPLFFLFELLYSIKMVKQNNIDCIISMWLLPQGLVGAICSKILNVPHVATIHSSEVTFIKKIPFGNKISEHIINNSSSIVSVSLHRAKELQSTLSLEYSELFYNKLRIIPMGIDTAKFKTDNKIDLQKKYIINSRFVILFVGRLVEVKGCLYLIESLKDVVDEISDVLLLIAGDGPLRNELENKIRYYSLENNVRFQGYVEPSKIVDFYSVADIVVIPSIVDSSDFQEGLPVVALESLAAGKPIVSTKTKGLMEVIEDSYNGILVEQKNSEQISSAILKLLKNENLRNYLSKNARLTSKKYDWDLISNRYFNVVEEALYGEKN